MADAEKAKGNTAFSAGDYTTAITHFTNAIGLGPTHVLYSNRSACYCGLRKYQEALDDVRRVPAHAPARSHCTAPARPRARSARPVRE